MPIKELKDQIANLPNLPGVYLYLNRTGETIYVGRAKVLKDRVRSYLGAYGTSPKTDVLLEEIVGLEVIVTDSLVEALVLENNLIKHRMPRYNILLRDDKNYPYLQVTRTESYPRVLVARQVARDGNFYAGPFLPSPVARKAMSLTHRLFGIRSCNEVITGKRDRPCLEYDIKRCVAPCVDELCSQEDYAAVVRHAEMFLDGRNDELKKELEKKMQSASQELRFEEAANIRDALKLIDELGSRRQKMATAKLGDRDAFGVKSGPLGAVIQVFQMRGGRVIERVELVIDEISRNFHSDKELLGAALQQFYEERGVPPEVHVPLALADEDTLTQWLATRAGRQVRLYVPKRGQKRGLLDLANRNAELTYVSRYSQDAKADSLALEELRSVLDLSGRLRRLECFDVSTIQGAETVGAMVVTEDGRMDRRAYRKYRIRDSKTSINKPNDFAAMEEIVLRRYRRLLEQGGPFPDLVIVDGGKGQLSAAYKAFEQLGLSNLIAIGIAKKEEVLVVKDRKQPIVLPRHSSALRLVQRMRDEAHRFAVTFHRSARKSRDFRSELDQIPGVGPKRRKLLLNQFGSVRNIRLATEEQLKKIVGVKLACVICKQLR